LKSLFQNSLDNKNLTIFIETHMKPDKLNSTRLVHKVLISV